MGTALLIAWLVGAPAASERVAQCWDIARRMEADGISRESVEAWATKCLGAALRPPVPECRREWGA